MFTPEADYLREQILNHTRLFFVPEIYDLLNSRIVRFVPYEQAININEPIIVIPTDIKKSNQRIVPYSVPFNSIQLTLWNRVEKPSTGEWRAVPNESAPLWYQKTTGTVIPAWNLFGNLFDLLTFNEERQVDQRDGHGRFAAAFSPRKDIRLLEIPAFNEAVAALAGAAFGCKKNGKPQMSLDTLLKPPVVVLSHDCDILLGNDLWTQLVRAYRIFAPLLKVRLPKIGNVWWLMRNALTPRVFYFDNIKGMINIERSFGYHSAFYFINGSGGRFGRRSGLEIIEKTQKQIPLKWECGIHYNYDTFLNHDSFDRQIKELKSILTKPIKTGRAHYLRFDSARSFQFLESFGIEVDESAGYADSIGYRCGVGGCYRPYDFSSEKAHSICEVPMVIMDATLVNQYGDKAVNAFVRLLKHLQSVGGALSFIIHPGQFYNPENKRMLGLYHKILIECRQLGVVSRTAAELTAEVNRDK